MYHYRGVIKAVMLMLVVLLASFSVPSASAAPSPFRASYSVTEGVIPVGDQTTLLFNVLNTGLTPMWNIPMTIATDSNDGLTVTAVQCSETTPIHIRVFPEGGTVVGQTVALLPGVPVWCRYTVRVNRVGSFPTRARLNYIRSGGLYVSPLVTIQGY